MRKVDIGLLDSILERLLLARGKRIVVYCNPTAAVPAHTDSHCVIAAGCAIRLSCAGAALARQEPVMNDR